jgi:ribonuclease D
LLYAALDVELLVPLRDRMARDLREQGKLEWAQQEFEALTSFTGPKAKPDPWRRVSGTRSLRTRRHLATLQALWNTREDIARRRDVSPGRIVPDSTLVDLAARAPRHREDLAAATPDPSAARQRRAQQGLRRHAAEWLAAISEAAALPEEDLPSRGVSAPGPPPARSWADRDPEAAARLNAAKILMQQLSEQHEIPVENLITPELLRRVLWDPPQSPDLASVEKTLADAGARPWQQQIVAPVVLAAVRASTPGDTPEWEISHM